MDPHKSPQTYSSAFLPAAYEGMPLGKRPSGTLVSPRPVEQQRKQIDLIQQMNQDLLQRKQEHSALEGVIASFETGFRMQNTLPELMDLSKESRETQAMYGGGFGRQCLLARRLAEAGVRYIEINSKGWDHHVQVMPKIKSSCRRVDQGIAALLTDLKQRGMLDDTLVIWGGEFGRQPTREGDEKKAGRNHNARGFTMWLAGGGVNAGHCVGATDEHGLAAVDNPVHVSDLHATILHLLGLDHQKLTYRYGGRDYSLTDVHGQVVENVLA